MSNKRMFSLTIVDTDAFLDMPISSQLLYFHLVMRADDEGFIGSPKKIMRLISVQDDDLKILILKRFVLSFDKGIVVVKHWLIHNTIRMDRFNKTVYTDEKEQITIKKNKAYTELATKWQPNGNQMATKWQHKLSKVKLSKVKLSKVKLSENKNNTHTPSKITKEFFENKEKQDALIVQLMEKYNVDKIGLETEINKFISYWTENNHSGTKQRWQTEKTFEINRRLGTWFNNIKAFNKSKTLIV